MLLLYLPFKKFKKIIFVIIFIILLYFLSILFKRNSNLKKVEYKKFITTKKINQKIEVNFNNLLNASEIAINYNVHIFYYAWYGNLNTDKSWKHWNHKRLTHWNKALQGDFDESEHIPPKDIGADFYPVLGLYSSRNKEIRRMHLRLIRYTGVGVVVLSWYPQNMSDPNGGPVDDLVKDMLDDAHLYNLKVALHIEPYAERSVISVKKDLLYIYSKYSRHAAYFKRVKFGQEKELPVVYIYDSYRIEGSEWFKLLGKNQPLTIRKKKEDFFVVGLHFERSSCTLLSSAGFDAAYTYFISEQTSYGSSSTNWEEINKRCSSKNVIFFPSLGPGYKDISVRPWNSAGIQEREGGQFYVKNFLKIKELNITSFGITSFNEWHEGTQIEPAIPHDNDVSRSKYEDYSPHSPMFYLQLTRSLVDNFTKNVTFHL